MARDNSCSLTMSGGAPRDTGLGESEPEIMAVLDEVMENMLVILDTGADALSNGWDIPDRAELRNIWHTGVPHRADREPLHLEGAESHLSSGTHGRGLRIPFNEPGDSVGPFSRGRDGGIASTVIQEVMEKILTGVDVLSNGLDIPDRAALSNAVDFNDRTKPLHLKDFEGHLSRSRPTLGRGRCTPVNKRDDSAGVLSSSGDIHARTGEIHLEGLKCHSSCNKLSRIRRKPIPANEYDDFSSVPKPLPTKRKHINFTSMSDEEKLECMRIETNRLETFETHSKHFRDISPPWVCYDESEGGCCT